MSDEAAVEELPVTTTAVKLSVDRAGVATLLLDRAERCNAFDDAMIAAMNAACEQLAVDPALRVLVLTASGPHFSAGADLGWMQRMAAYDYESNLRDARALAELLHRLNTLPQITIARVQGAAFGGAVGLVSCCDMAVATPAACFSLSEVKLGLIPATICPYVVAAIGARAARRYLTTAESFSAGTALQLGLISEIVEEDELDRQVCEWVDAILANGPRAVTAAKQLLARVADRPLDAALIEQTSECIARMRVSAEGQEGLNAFLQKRQPQWEQE